MAHVQLKRRTRLDPAGRLLELAGARCAIAIAFSGGLDSTVLAHALAQRRRRFASLRLLHVDHGLQAASGEWARDCERRARRWKLPITVLRANVSKSRGESPEAAAREARYALLSAALDPGEVLVTAQHRDDQVETLLLQLFRGAGVNGLAAMPEIARFGPGRIARPLLGVERESIETYARRHRLTWIEDPTNTLPRFGRNYLRHRVMPLLREKWPGVDDAIARSARHMAEAADLLGTLARADLAAAADGNGLNVAVLRALPPKRRRNALRGFIAAAGVELPSTAKLNEITGPLFAARADAQPSVKWAGGVLRRRAGRLELDVKPEVAASRSDETALKSWFWRADRECVINDAGDRLSLVDDAVGAIDLDALPLSLELRARMGGETLRPGVRARTQSLKKLLQAARLTVEERARIPLLFTGDRLVAAGDRWIDASIAANVKSRRRARLIWTRGG
jgi:tRNA(Ile)-lysidine synthase